MQALFDAELNPTEFKPLNISAPFQGKREGWVHGWLMSYTGSRPSPGGRPVFTLNKYANENAYAYTPICFGLSPEISIHIRQGGDLYLYHEGTTIQIDDAMRRGLAWEIKPV